MPGTTMTTARTASRSIYKERIIDVLLGVPVFFLLRLSFVFNMHILGPAYFCALLPVRLRRISGLFWGVIALFTLPNAQLRWKYGLIFLFLLLIDGLWRKLVRDKQPVLKSICLAATLPMSVISLWMLRQIDGYRFFMTLLEAAIFYGFIRMYERSLRILENQRYNAWIGFSENIMETACMVGTLLAAISFWSFWQIVPWQILHVLFISTIVYRCGVGSGSIFTMLTVLLLRLSGCCSEGYGMLCLILALVGGFFRDMGRLVQSLAGISSGILYLILFMMQSRPYTVFIALMISQGLFYFLPEGWYKPLVQKSEAAMPRMEEQYIQRQLQRLEAALLYAADVITDKPVQHCLSEKDMALLCSDIAGRMCEKCTSHPRCWGNEFHATYRVIGEVMQATQRTGRICRSDITGDFLERCPKGDEFVRMVNRYFEIYRLNLSWENRLEKNMRLSSMQLRSVAVQLMNLMQDMGSSADLEKKLFRKLSGLGYSVSGIWVESEKEHVRGIRIRLDQERTQRSVRQVEEQAQDCIGYPMVVQACHSCGHRIWEWELREKLAYMVMTGVVSSGREDINGDCYIRDRLGYDQYLLALSDGMGTGAKARKESELALSLLEKLLAAGIPEEDAVSQLNLLLLLHNREETYTTLDLGLMHLGTGELTVVKAGGALTLVKTQERIDRLQAGTLPIGILDDVDPSIYHRKLEDGDLVLMMSDGIIDQVTDIKQAELLIRKTLRSIPDTVGPQQVAETIYEVITETYGNQIEDDITILAARLKAEA